jgi:hypothetical protein
MDNELRRWISILDEAFAPPIAWKWETQSKIEWVALFRIKPVKYTVSLFRYDSTMDAWELSFVAATAKKDYGFSQSGTGNAWTVFGTVIAITRQFIEQKHPTILKITNEGAKRFAVNSRLAKAIMAGFPYELQPQDTDYPIDELVMQRTTVTPP